MKVGDPGWQQHFINRNKEIMKLLDEGWGMAAVARRFGVTNTRVQQIRRKETWRREAAK
jgi:hypothetical protein